MILLLQSLDRAAHRRTFILTPMDQILNRISSQANLNQTVLDKNHRYNSSHSPRYTLEGVCRHQVRVRVVQSGLIVQGARGGLKTEQTSPYLVSHG